LATLAVFAAVGSVSIVFEAVTVARLDGPAGEQPTRVYARPYVLYAGMSADREYLEAYLDRLGYVAVRSTDVGPGEYSLGSRALVIGRRHFRHHERLSRGGRLVVRLGSSGRISRLEDSDGRELAHVALEPELIGSLAGQSDKDRVPVFLSDVPSHLVDAILTIEDQRFFDHKGLDVRRIAAAMLVNVRAGRVVQGGSTLTQQLAKNLFLSPRRTLIRKVREASIALVLESRHSKEEILEAYLNEVYLGQNGGLAIHGVGRAAQHYFGKDVSRLDLAESALLAALIRGPSLYSPHRRPDAAKGRRDLVLNQMLARGVISEDAYVRALEKSILVRRPHRPAHSARYFFDFLESRLRSELGGDVEAGAGLAVFTSLDMRLQRLAEEAVRAGFAQLESQYPQLVQEGAKLQAALVALDPRSGDILAFVGGRDYGESQFNRASSARRQPGSAFKPIVALAALSARGWGENEDDRPFTLASVLEDERLVVATPAGPWEPVNYDRSFRGRVTVRDALERSLNVPFARLGMEVGPPRIVEVARDLGIESPLYPVPSLALGSSEVSLLELTRAYGVLAAGGFRAGLRPILAVLDREGNVRDQNQGEGVRVFDSAESYLVTSALRGAVERGTGRALRALGYHGEVAAKSGTTNDFRDGWFIGYTPTLAVGVWVGFDDGRSIGLPGARVALPIFTRFLAGAAGAYGNRGPYGSSGFAYPNGLDMVEVDPRTGLRAGPGCRGRMELFLPGTAPEESCSPLWILRRGWRDVDPAVREQLSRWRDQLLRRLQRQRSSGNSRNRSP
jgi:penicillin-binding protein 1B